MGGEIMFQYQKKLQYPVNIKKKDLRMAKYLVTQYGGRYIKRDLQKVRKVSLYELYIFKDKIKQKIRM